MKKKRSPSQQQYTNYRYARGARSSIMVAVRTIDELKMTPEQVVEFLTTYRDVLCRQFEADDGKIRLKRPFIDGCVNEVLHVLNERGNEKGIPHQIPQQDGE